MLGDAVAPGDGALRTWIMRSTATPPKPFRTKRISKFAHHGHKRVQG